MAFKTETIKKMFAIIFVTMTGCPKNVVKIVVQSPYAGLKSGLVYA